MVNVIETMRATFAGNFMQPECYRGSDIEEAILEAGLDCEADGIYCRLSASGYLDCTDWHGPFETVADAAQCLIDTYGEEA